jgi:hypothetical protein
MAFIGEFPVFQEMRIPFAILPCLFAFPAFGAKPLNPLAIH